MNFAAAYDSPFGRLVATSADGLTLSSLRFKSGVDTLPNADLAIFQTTFRCLDKYFAGIFPKKLPPISVSPTPFQEKVWREIRRIPAGATITYSDLGKKVRCSSAQAVGNAVAQNPILILVPCHRVVRADGIGDYSAGADLKAALLSFESRFKEESPSLFSEV